MNRIKNGLDALTQNDNILVIASMYIIIAAAVFIAAFIPAAVLGFIITHTPPAIIATAAIAAIITPAAVVFIKNAKPDSTN